MRSMTGYGFHKYSDENYDIEVEIKSLNNRYLDLEVKLRNSISNYEYYIRDFINERLKRGKIIVSINYEDKNKNRIEVNLDLINYLYDMHSKANKLLNLEQEFKIQDSFVTEGVLVRKGGKITDDSFMIALTKALELCFAEYDAMSQEEGDNIKKWFESFQDLNKKGIVDIKAQLPHHKQLLKDKVFNSVDEIISKPLSEDVEKRLLVELSLYMDKYDVTEEIHRFEDFIIRLDDILKSDYEQIGKKINFVLQEMHREIQTLGSKFKSVKSLNSILLIKEEIEKGRELIQNVE